MLAQKLMGSAGGASDKLYVDDVFSTYLYTGNGSTRTINNGIDLAGKGGLVWIKARSIAYSNSLWDTLRGGSADLHSESTQASGVVSGGISAFGSAGFTLDSSVVVNASSQNYASWTFRKAPKFFDVVTYIGNGSASKVLTHSLGITPGMIIVKATSTTGAWAVWHRSGTQSNTYAAFLEQTAAYGDTGANVWGTGGPIVTDSSFTVGSNGTVNANGVSYVAYLFAHDPSTDGIIQCGGFTTDASGNATVNLGWEPQYLMFKSSSTAARNWDILDSSRGFNVTSITRLFANLSNAESVIGTNHLPPNAQGFELKGLDTNTTMIYLAIRRPNKPPTTGTQVFSATTYVATNTDNRLVDTGIVTDSVFAKIRGSGSAGYDFASGNRLTGNAVLMPSRTIAETMDSNALMTPTVGFGNAFSAMNGFGCGNNNDSSSGVFNLLVGGVGNYVAYAFRRAPGFFDVVCYTGTGATHTESHNLGAVPELIIVKGRSAATQWVVYSSALGATKYLSLNSTAAEDIFSGFWNNVTPTSSVFTVGTGVAVNQNSQTYVAYLFATKVGISKVGNYTGNGGTQTIACGFTTGARFILIKRTESTGDWYVWDTARGIVSANDPHLSLNTTASEVTTDDSVDPTNEGFIVNNVSPTNINVNAASYIYLAIA